MSSVHRGSAVLSSTRLVLGFFLVSAYACDCDGSRVRVFRGSYKTGASEPKIVITTPKGNVNTDPNRSPWGIGYYIPPGESRMESGLPPEEEEVEEDDGRVPPEGAEFFIDAKEQDFLVEDVIAGVDRGRDIGVGVRTEIHCVVGERPMGDDEYHYCRTMTKENELRMKRMAKGEWRMTLQYYCKIKIIASLNRRNPIEDKIGTLLLKVSVISL